MDILNSVKNLLYKIDNNGIDEYGIDHSKFSIRDEIEYNIKRSQEKNSNFNQNNNCSMEFDGNNLNLYKDGKLVNSLDAMSGNPDYQSIEHQNKKGLGPIPEGIWFANQNQRQNISALDAIIGVVKQGKWPGSLPAWGTKRVWLQPDENTNTYGRSGFTIHGGWSKGSAGCIDIPGQTDKLSNYLDDCQYSVPVNVKYPKNRW